MTETTPPLITFETWVSYPARTVNAEDGLRIEFSVPVHLDLQPHITDPTRTEILCKYRVRYGFKWGQLGRQASVKVSGYVETGPRGGQYFHCKSVEILAGKPRPKTDPAVKRLEKRLAKQAGVELPKNRAAGRSKKKKNKRSRKPSAATADRPSQPTLFD